MKKIVPLLLALVGLALIIAAIVVWLEPPKDGGVFTTAGTIISFLFGAGASIKGWMDLFKKEPPAKNETSYTASQDGTGAVAQGENSRAVGQQGIMADEVSGGMHNYYGPVYQTSPNPKSEIENRKSANTLPTQPFFFGRAKELEIIASALSHESRTWGALIDGPGGIGKTALAIKAAHDAPEDLFERKIFITAKVRELTPEGEKKLTDFTRPTYLAMLDELGKELGEEGLEKLPPDDRPNELRLALAGKKALIVFDNLETLPEEERTRLFQFLSRLPEGNKAIVTSRRRSDVDARIVRLDRLSHEEALQLINELAKKYPRLGRATAEEHEKLYAITQGNPLFIRWIAGQLGREGSKLRTIDEAVHFIDSAPKGNDPLEYIFGDLLKTFSLNETKVLAALTHFTQPAKPKWLADMTELPQPSTETALEDLADRSVLISNVESSTFHLPPLTAKFIKTRRPEAVTQTGDALTNRVYALVMQYGDQRKDYEKFPKLELEAEWDFISTALPRLLTGDNTRLQDFCDQLDSFLNSTGRWDENLWLSEQAEDRAVVVNDKEKAGLRALTAGWIYYNRRQPAKVLACIARIEEYWQSLDNYQYLVNELRASTYELQEDYPAAIAAQRELLEFYQSIVPESDHVAFALNKLAYAKQLNGDFPAAERDFNQALRIAKKNDNPETVGTILGFLANFALYRRQWIEAESFARESLAIAEKVENQQLIALDYRRIAKALIQQKRNLEEALSLTHRAVEIFKRYKMSDILQDAQEMVVEIEKMLKEK